MAGSEKERSGAEAVDYLKTQQEADAELKKREAEQKAGPASGSGDSPKPHGDKLEHATNEAAKR